MTLRRPSPLRLGVAFWVAAVANGIFLARHPGRHGQSPVALGGRRDTRRRKSSCRGLPQRRQPRLQ